MRRAAFLSILIAAALMSGCISGERTSVDSDYNYAVVFQAMRQPKPVLLNSRLERYSKHMGAWTSNERNGEWEFEILAPRAWVDEVKNGFVPIAFSHSFRRPSASWWAPTEEAYEAFEMPYSSYAAAHLYVEKKPKDENRIHVFIQRH